MIQKTKTIYRLLGMAIMKKEVETSVDESNIYNLRKESINMAIRVGCPPEKVSPIARDIESFLNENTLSDK
jgi:hypothetical protein